MAAMKKMIVDRRAGGGDFIDETKAALLRAVMGVGFTGWHKLPTTNLVVELLMMREANSDGSFCSEQVGRKG